MKRLNFKAILFGALVFIVCYVLFVTLANFQPNDNLSGWSYWVTMFIFILPGFVAAHASKKDGVLHGAAVGVFCGFVFISLYFIYQVITAPSPGSVVIEFILMFTGGLTFFTSLGGLFWQVYNALIRKTSP